MKLEHKQGIPDWTALSSGPTLQLDQELLDKGSFAYKIICSKDRQRP